MKSMAAILIVFCLAHLQNINADVKVHRKSIVTTDKKLAFWVESYTDEHLTYALCDDKHPQADDVKCTVIREKEPYGNDTYSCDVTLKRPRGPHNPKHLPQISVYPFGQRYVALTLWEEDKYLNFSVVQMDSCKVNETGIDTGSPLDRISMAVVGHSDSFDVFLKDAASVSCGDKMCKATIGADGRLINEPKPSIKKCVRADPVLRPVVALDNGPSGNGYFYVTADGHNYVHVLVKPDGTEKSLASHPKPTGIVGVSTKNNLLGVCYQMNDTLEYSQYDFDGNLKIRTTITSYHNYYAYFDIYNLSNGGFYVFGAECNKSPYGGCADYTRFSIERVDANGAKTGSIVFQGFDRSFDNFKVMTPLVYENDAKEVCFSLAVTRAGEGVDGGRIELTANCFTDADFSK